MSHTPLEEIFRNKLSEAETEVPAETWKAIESKLDAFMPVTATQPSGTGWKAHAGKWIGGSAFVTGAAALLFYLTLRTNPAIQPETTAVTSAAIPEINQAGQPSEKAIQPATVAVRPPSPAKPQPESIADLAVFASNEVFTANDEIKPPAESTSEQIETSNQLPDALTGDYTKSENRPEEGNHLQPEESFFTEAEAVTAPDAVEHILKPALNFNDVMTPNADNVNDIFRVEANEAVGSFTVTVMNLSGKVIHQWSAPNGFWDGRMDNGSMAPAGKYLIDIFVKPVNGIPYHLPATLQLIR